mgnify:CR=1 FL=1
MNDKIPIAIAFRLTEDLHARVRAYRERLLRETPGVSINFSDALRALVHRGLVAEEERRTA